MVRKTINPPANEDSNNPNQPRSDSGSDTEKDRPDTATIETIVAEHTQEVAGEQPAAVVPGEVPKRRGRPKGSKNAPKTGTPAVNTTAALIPRPAARAIITLPYALIAKRYGEHWNLSEQESESMVDVHLAAAERYMPDIVKKSPELYALALVHGMIVFAKMEMHYKIQREKQPERPDLIKSAPAPTANERPVNEENNSFSRENGLRKEFSSFGVHQTATEIDNI